MNGGMVGKAGWLVLGMAGAVAAAPHAARAQPASDFKLPPATASAQPEVQGPVDPQNPVMTAPKAQTTLRPPPALTEKLAPVPAPIITPQPVTSRAAATAPARRRAAPTPTLTSTSTPTLASTPSAGHAGPPPAAGPAAAPSSAPPVGFPGFISNTAAPVPAPAASVSAGPQWWWIAGAAFGALVLVLAGFAWGRRGRRAMPPEVRFEPPAVSRDDAPVTAEPSPPASLQSHPVSEGAPPETPAEPATGLILALEATRMNASLVATTLNYRLRLTNRTGTPLSGLTIEGDMVAAQAGTPPERQLASPGQALEPRHALPALEAGASAEFGGSISLPLAAINPIRAGSQALFIPLARFRVVARDGGGRPLDVTRTFVVGEAPRAPGAQLRPFRLDLGPRTYSQVAQRALA